jgi:hypothetical protein
VSQLIGAFNDQTAYTYRESVSLSALRITASTDVYLVLPGLGFGPDVTRKWCELNGVTGILRSHEVRQGGYAIEHEGLCTTVFSAPNYVDQVRKRQFFLSHA